MGDSTVKVSKTSVRDIHPWAGKRVAIFGDSMTDPEISFTKTKWWGFLQQWIDIKPYVYAVNGREWNDIPRQTDALIREHGQDVDAVIIFMGTNDFNAGVPTGRFFSEKREETEASTGMKNGDLRQMRLHRSFVMDGSTLAGRINIALSRLKDTYPDKQIVLLTPVHRGYARFGDTNVQPDELWQNAAGQWFDEYVATVKKAGEIWSVPVVDLYSESGYFPLSDAFAPYVHDKATDRLHASDNGNRRLALTLLYRLFSLPCSLK